MNALRSDAGAQASTGSRIQRIVSPRGIEAWLIEEQAVPLVALELFFEGGSAQDPEGQSGLANFLSGMFDEGAGPLDAIAFQETLDEHAIQLRFSATRDGIGGSLKTLVRHKDKAFDMLRLALAEPRFDAAAVERVRAQIIGGIKRGANDPGRQSSKAWNARAFSGHPYATPGEGIEADVAAIGADDLRAAHRRLIARSNLKIAVVGAIGAEDVSRMLDLAFGGLPEQAGLKPVPLVQPSGLGELQVIDLDIPQSTIRFGLPGLLRKDEDFVAATVMNHILGGGSFTSRMWQEVREKRGLAYSVSTGLQPLRHTGVLMGGTATKNERAREALDVIRGEIARWRRKGRRRRSWTRRSAISSDLMRSGSTPRPRSRTTCCRCRWTISASTIPTVGTRCSRPSRSTMSDGCRRACFRAGRCL